MSSFKSEPQSPSTASPNSSSGLYSLGGRGGGPSHGTQQAEATSPRYLYYRLYATDGAIRSWNPIYSNDLFISRILRKSLTPPRTALSLKMYICKIEGLAGSNASVFESLSSDVAMADSARLALRGNVDLGASSREPMVLVVGAPEAGKRSNAPRMGNKFIENPDPCETRYIYYRVYGKEGEENSKTAFDESDTFLGRVDTLSVAPPYTVASLKTRIVKVEGIADQEIQLFEDTDGEVLMKDTDRAPFFAETFPGCVQAEPLAVVHGPKTPSSTSTMTKAIRAKYNFTPGNDISTWHTYSMGEILHTDGVKTTSIFAYSDGYQKNHRCYMAVNSAGREACVHLDNFTFC